MSWLSSFFKKKQQLPPLESFKPLLLDFHSHLIPGIDDGVKTVDEAVEVVKALMELGFGKIITTPHVMTDGYNNSNEIILKGRDDVRNALKQSGINVEFEAAAEYYIDETLLPKIKNKSLLTLKDKFVLVELSYVAAPLNLTTYFFELNAAGYKVILAHPERYPFYYRKDISAFEEVREKGVYFQMNLGSLAGVYGEGAKKAAEMLVDAEMIDFVATDIHNMKLIPRFQNALQLPYVRKIVENEHLLNSYLM